MKVSIFWFRRDLRIEDNHGLSKALKESIPVLPLFIFDINILKNLDANDLRVEFIYKQLEILNKEFLKKKTALLIKHGKPEDIFSKLISEFQVANVFTNHDYEPYAIERDLKISRLLKKSNIGFHSFKDQVIFEKSEILNESGLPYKVYTHYKNKWKSFYNTSLTNKFPSEKLDNFYQTKPFHFPGIESIGFNKTDFKFPDKEFNIPLIKSYDKTRDFPYLEGTTRLGLHLRFGTVSIREAVKIGGKYNETWLNELIWREFFMQLIFHFPDVIRDPFNKKFKNLPWRYNDEDFKKWCEGKTGYPLVDAGMRQLNASGFMHNRVRMVCASFLAKHLLLDWRLGEQYFADKLLDFELSSNNGNWQWAAGTGADAQPFFRIFNPIMQQKKFDPEFIYIKKWVPEYGTSSYPLPMVDHKFAVDRAKKAFNVIK